MKDASQAEAEQRFSEQFHALTDHLSEAQLSIALGRSVGAVRGLRGGPTKMLKLDVALRLCRYLVASGMNVTPWDLLGETPPSAGDVAPAASPDRLQRLEDRVDGLKALFEEVVGANVAATEKAAPKTATRSKPRAR